jgi:hypothetical protein
VLPTFAAAWLFAVFPGVSRMMNAAKKIQNASRPPPRWDPERDRAPDAVPRVLVEALQRLPHRSERQRRARGPDLVGLGAPAPCRADEHDEQPGDAADRDVRG